ncbi:glycosyltransferase [Beijerinckia indica]|uniref:glycosyltransferase n=1 Tax=Beijerinckia indica TaxID=533 RepID=UPI0011D03800|nr:glycosyltransferase [Beijerinckia indica]
MEKQSLRFSLAPERDVTAGEDGFVALSAQPWLIIEAWGAFAPGAFVEIIYTASLWDVPVRPVFRFRSGSGSYTDQIAPGPVAGKGVWRGFVPADCTAISVSPTNRPGRFDFAILSLRRVSTSEMARLAFVRDRNRTRAALLRLLQGKRREAARLLEQAVAGVPLADSLAWVAERTRPTDLTAIDRPRSDWHQGPWIHILLSGQGAGKQALKITIEALQAQIYPRWTLILPTEELAADARAFCDDEHVRYQPAGTIAEYVMGLPGTDLVAEVDAGDRWRAWGLACLAEAAMRYPEKTLFYGDEETVVGRILLKPGWSPDFFQAGAFLGKAFAVRIEAVKSDGAAPAASVLSAARLAALPPGEVLPLHRVLLKRREGGPNAGMVTPPVSPSPSRSSEINPSAMIILPIRDGAEKLGRSIASIYERTRFDNYSILIVDDDSVEEDTKHLFKLIKNDRLISVLHNPGGVGLGALCNAATARRRADMIVFLDNGVEILSEDWLDRLLALAMRSEIGAVGVRMLDSRGAILPSAFVLGSGDDGGEPRSDIIVADSPEAELWRERDSLLHEVAAVGGGCLAIARRKFLLLGGFAAEPVLPPSLLDQDLCLRLAAHGQRSCIEPSVRLRRDAPRPSAGEAGAEWFAQQWFDRLRDDPCFHPGFALRSGALSLG